MGYEIVTEPGNVSVDDIELTRCLIGHFEKMRSVPSKEQAHLLEEGERPTLQNVRSSKVAIFAGSFHGKSTFTKSNPSSAEGEMDPDLFKERFPELEDLHDMIVHYDSISDEDDSGEEYDLLSSKLMATDIPIVVSHLTDVCLDAAVESGRRIAFIVGDYHTIDKRMDEYYDKAQDKYRVASRSISAMGYFMTLWRLNVRGPTYTSFEEAIKGLAIGADYVELPYPHLVAEGS
jgi:hypothetical protein